MGVLRPGRKSDTATLANQVERFAPVPRDSPTSRPWSPQGCGSVGCCRHQLYEPGGVFRMRRTWPMPATRSNLNAMADEQPPIHIIQAGGPHAHTPDGDMASATTTHRDAPTSVVRTPKSSA